MGAVKTSTITVTVDYHMTDGEGNEISLEATVEIIPEHPATYSPDGRQTGAHNERQCTILTAAWLNPDGTMEREIPPQYIGLRMQAAIIARALDCATAAYEIGR